MARVLSKVFPVRITRTIHQAAVAGVPQPRMGTIRDGRRGKGSRCYIIGRSDGSATDGCVEDRVAGTAAPIPAIHIEDTGATRTSAAVGTGIFDQVPTISPGIPPDDDTPVRLVARKRLERHARGLEALIVAREIVRLKEKPDPPAALLSDGCGLAVSDGPGKQDLGIATRGRNPHPPLAVAQFGILPALETDPAEEVERRVVVRDQQGQVGDAGGHDIVLSKGKVATRFWGTARSATSPPMAFRDLGGNADMCPAHGSLIPMAVDPGDDHAHRPWRSACPRPRRA